MGHNVGDQANRAVKKSEKKAAAALRTPEERLAAIRGSLAAKLFVTPDDQRFLLIIYDQAISDLAWASGELRNAKTAWEIAESEIITLRAQVEQFRTVYEQENRSTTVKVERVIETGPETQTPADLGEDGYETVLPDNGVEPTHHEPFVDHGGEA